MVGDFVIPNGLAFSPDESVLYINDSRKGHIRAFHMQPNGTLALASDRVYATLRGERPGAPDGMKVDVEGNMYCGGSGGIWVLDPNGKHLGTIVHGAPVTTNIAWGGSDWKTLFFTTRHTVGSIQLKIAGVPVPAGGWSVAGLSLQARSICLFITAATVLQPRCRIPPAPLW